jgi:hypothetical protein
VDLRRKIRVRTLATFFKLAEEFELGTGGIHVPKYPGAAFLFFIVQWANEHGKMPSFVYQQYLKNPKDFRLLMSFRGYKAQREKEEMKEAENKTKNKTSFPG